MPPVRRGPAKGIAPPPGAVTYRRGTRPPSDWDIAAGCVGLYCAQPWLQLVVRLGAEPPTLSGGVGGWETTARPRQVAMTTWQGTDPYQLELPVMFDGFADRTSQETAIKDLYTAARGDDDSDPSPWMIYGIWGLPADEWVLQAVSAGGAIRRGDMRRTRQELSLTFLEYVPPEWVRLRKAALSAPKAKTTIYTVKGKDTPAAIARKRGCKWTDLRTLNPTVVKKANTDLRDGSKLRVPVAKNSGKKKANSKKAAGKKDDDR